EGGWTMKRDIDIKEFPIGEEIYWRLNIGTDITVISAEEAKELLSVMMKNEEKIFKEVNENV
ncbi:MAG: hypothetical protein E6370_17640, partial [Clostridiales bacterium]|nr:hypothetical protein [Clostridiales bacterium]